MLFIAHGSLSYLLVSFCMSDCSRGWAVKEDMPVFAMTPCNVQIGLRWAQPPHLCWVMHAEKLHTLTPGASLGTVCGLQAVCGIFRML